MSRFFYSAAGGGRTHMRLLPLDFESSASASSATAAFLTIIPEFFDLSPFRWPLEGG